MFQFIPVSKDDKLKESSKKIYKKILNQLSSVGYDSIDVLINKAEEVIELIQEVDSKRERRTVVSAIFYILCDTDYIKSSNPYYVYFQTLKDERT